MTPGEMAGRIEALRGYATEDGIAFSEASLSDFTAIMEHPNVPSPPSLFLEDNGHLRALWSRGLRGSLGVEFCGDDLFMIVLITPNLRQAGNFTGSQAVLAALRALQDAPDGAK